MNDLKFEWDSKKNTTNVKKHRISFDEAKTVFLDDNAAIANDPEHSTDENRYIIIGFTSSGRLTLVCFCERANGNVIRIISARKLTRNETKQFAKDGYYETGI